MLLSWSLDRSCVARGPTDESARTVVCPSGGRLESTNEEPGMRCLPPGQCWILSFFEKPTQPGVVPSDFCEIVLTVNIFNSLAIVFL